MPERNRSSAARPSSPRQNSSTRRAVSIANRHLVHGTHHIVGQRGDSLDVDRRMC
ncbi:hypothetical protein [Lentzea sp.]|uniref:hypothetical protein n=1 Tax=Lentzea sp. TaxID=56099 RepID=UPI002ED2E089